MEIKEAIEKERLDEELNSVGNMDFRTKEKFLLPDYEREELITEKCRAYPEIKIENLKISKHLSIKANGLSISG